MMSLFNKTIAMFPPVTFECISLGSSFHAFLAFCEVEPNPAKDLPRWRETPRRIITPNDDDVKRALDTAVSMCHSGEAAAVRDGCIFALSVVSGNRRGELRNLPMSDLMTRANAACRKRIQRRRESAGVNWPGSVTAAKSQRDIVT